mgnify:CR=1 FL=1
MFTKSYFASSYFPRRFFPSISEVVLAIPTFIGSLTSKVTYYLFGGAGQNIEVAEPQEVSANLDGNISSSRRPLLSSTKSSSVVGGRK